VETEGVEEAEAGAKIEAGPWARFAWCTFDWANSAFPTVVITFVFAAYFTKAVAADEVTGTSEWAYALSLSALAVAVACPILGAIADKAGLRVALLMTPVFMALGVVAFFLGEAARKRQSGLTGAA
jgi:UMF1 family MFS transporter